MTPRAPATRKASSNASPTAATRVSSARSARSSNVARSSPLNVSRCSSMAFCSVSRGLSVFTLVSSAGASGSLSCGGRRASSTRATPRSRASWVTWSSWALTSGASAARTATIPAWRTVRMRAASPAVRSGSSSPASAGSASPIPAPASACGRIVQAIEASGRKASAPVPAPISSAPAAARMPGAPGIRWARMAATGRTVTASAAATGSTLQPATSSRTSRKRTAVSAAETRASAAAGPAGKALRGGAGVALVRERAAATAAASAIGAWTMKIARQSNSWVGAPPSAGPAAVPKTAAATHRRRPRSPASISVKTASSAAAPPAACSERPASSTPSESAAAHSSEAAAKSPRPMAPTRAAPWRRSRTAAPGSASARTSTYTPRTAATPSTLVPSSRSSAGRASATIEASASAMPAATASRRGTTTVCRARLPTGPGHTVIDPSMPAPTLSRTLPDWPLGRPLRAWQREAAERLAAHDGTSFLASATPAAGKTTFGLKIAHEMLGAGRVRRVVVLGPTAHICRQWAADAARYGIDLEPNRPNAEGPEPRDRHGVAVTYQAVAAGSRTHARAAKRPTLVIADEPHHMGEHAAWGLTAQQAFAHAEFRLLLSGTPFRSDNSAIPWVAYDADGLSRADYGYGYPEALVDGVCRPITFLPYDGEMEWVGDAKLRRATFEVALPQAEAARRLRTALDAEGDWMGQVLRDADAKLAQVRAGGHPDAGGLVIAAGKEHAAAIAARLQQISGEVPEIVTSDEPDASARIAGFTAGTRRWLVSVLMVSEGVDIPRLRVGVYATPARTELFFRQVVGRFIRRTPAPREQMSYLLLPADTRLKELATRVEEERRHALTLEPGEPLVEEPAEPPERRAADEPSFTALSSSAFADEAILTETMQLFATEPAPTAALQAFSAPHTPAAAQPEATFASRERLREERAALVARLSRITGEEHRTIHGRINRATGATAVGSATREQLERGNALLARELSR